MKEKEVKKIVKDRYSKVAQKKSCCGGSTCDSSISDSDIARSLGYSDEDINVVPDANLGLGCGNPTALGDLRKGDIVLDLGSGAGFDSFLAAKKVGNTGKVIGVDMTKEMIQKARKNAKKYDFRNVEFRLGDIEELPVEDNTIDVIISNCVINLAPNKEKVFEEAYRVLKKGGRMYVSDIVLLEELTQDQRNNPDLVAGCIGGAILKEEYLKIIRKTGFILKNIVENKEISKTQYQGIPLESLNVTAYK